MTDTPRESRMTERPDRSTVARVAVGTVGEGRVYVGPEPDRGYAHPGYRGVLVLHGAWVHIPYETGEYLAIMDEPEGGVSHEWEPLNMNVSIPASSVDTIEWSKPPEWLA